MENKRMFERMTLNERIQHYLLLTSFVILVVTGAPLFLSRLKLFHYIIATEDIFVLRGALHRIAAILLVVLCIYHMGYVILTRRGRREIWLIFPRWKDIKDFFLHLKYNLGIVEAGPRYGRYNIIHKFEYWAVAWGSVVMIITGFILWFEEQAMIFLPKWVVDLSSVIHGYEATLAFLTIIIWHCYNVHFNPDDFPMSKIWLNGMITEEEMKKHHPLEYEELMKESAEEGKNPESHLHSPI